MKKRITSIEFVNSDLAELQAVLTTMVSMARASYNSMHGQDPWGGASSIDIQNQDGQELAEAILIEETLSDGSKVYGVELRFSNVE